MPDADRKSISKIKEAETAAMSQVTKVIEGNVRSKIKEIKELASAGRLAEK
jgi:hypothetical protein